MGVRVVDLGGGEWRSFVASRSESTVFHTEEWGKTLTSAYGFRHFGLLREDGDVVSAGMMVAEIARLGRRRWVSLPFSDYCPVLGEDADVRELVEDVEVMRSERGLRQVEIRGVAPGQRGELRRHGVLHRLELAADEDEMMRGLRRTQVGRNITRSEREQVHVSIDQSRESAAAFYALHLLTRRRQGVPIQPRAFFRALHENVIEPGLGFVAVARRERQPVAAAVVLDHKDTLTYKFGASDPEATALRPNHAVFWSMIRWGIEHGRRVLDMGRSDTENAGLRAFKSSWGAVEVPLSYAYLGQVAREHSGPERLLRPIIRKTPPWVCRTIGETLYRFSA